MHDSKSGAAFRRPIARCSRYISVIEHLNEQVIRVDDRSFSGWGLRAVLLDLPYLERKIFSIKIVNGEVEKVGARFFGPKQCTFLSQYCKSPIGKDSI
ncbi:hypothetical protein TNIN_116241 [Trichonephila inaurata madagascariensis]|uniref:Uncharacterized protein n=1 Tax=Trichonephila inaurata madagascariensis TaxID=2747483 RepID=A0A8X7BR71_9ARAC|nr:hypothetical protein TNIN_116241 [Trichonephila inaurata madagascariensis]